MPGDQSPAPRSVGVWAFVAAGKSATKSAGARTADISERNRIDAIIAYQRLTFVRST